MASWNRADRVIMGNKGLRSTPQEIKTCEDAASHGDAAAAKKLWDHYEFVAYDHEKGERWRDKYERLSKGETKPDDTSSNQLMQRTVTCYAMTF